MSHTSTLSFMQTQKRGDFRIKSVVVTPPNENVSMNTRKLTFKRRHNTQVETDNGITQEKI